MTSNLNGSTVKWLTYLVYILLSVLTLITGWHTVALSNLPDKYVRLERYQSDAGRIESNLKNISDKLDRLIERKVKNDGDTG